MRRVRCASALLAAIAALAVAGCGGSSGSSSGSSSAGTSKSSSSSTTPSVGVDTGQGGTVGAAAAKAADAAVTREGGPVKLPQRTLGLVNVTGESEAAQRIQQGAVNAAKAIGWKIITIDAQGDPARSQAGIQSLVSQHVDGILDLSNATQSITQGLAAARAANIPVIDIGGLQDPSPNIEAQFAVDEKQMTKRLDAYMLAHLPRSAKIATFTFPLLLSERLRDEQLRADLGGTAVKVVANHQIDFASAVADTQRAARAILTANPDLNAFWGDTDTVMPPIAQVLRSLGRCGKIQNYNYYDDKLNLAQIGNGCATAVVTSPVDADGWAAVDALAEMWSRNKPLSSLPSGWPAVDPIYGVQIRNGAAIQVIDRSNLPPAGQYSKPRVDFVTFFRTKWKREFGVG